MFKFNEEKRWNLWFMFILFIVPSLIYIFTVQFDSPWAVAIPYFMLLALVAYYHNKYFQKNNLISELEEKFQLIEKIKKEIQQKEKQHNSDDWHSRAIVDDIKDSMARSHGS